MNRYTHYLLLSIFIISFLLGLTRSVLYDPNRYNIHYSDWKLHLSWAGTTRNTILEYGQLPLWNPYRCGGVPVLGEPESDVFSPYLPLLLVFGPLVGYIAFFIINFFIGFIGFYKLGRYFLLSPLASVLISQSYMMSGLYIQPFFVGMTNFISLGFLPFVVLYYEKYLEEGSFADCIKAAFFTSLMFLSGFHYIPIIILYLITSTLIRSLQVHKLTELLKGIWVCLLFLGFSAIKLLRSIDLLLHHGPITYSDESTGGFSLTSLWYSLVSRDQTPSMISSLITTHTNFLRGVSYQIDENGMYVGVVLFLLFIYGYFYRTSRFSRLLSVMIIFVIISFGTNIYPSIYSFLKALPIISSIRVANRFRFIFMIPFVLMIGHGFDRIQHHATQTMHMHHKLMLALCGAFIVFITVDLLYVNFNKENILPIIHNIQIISPTTSNDFYNRCIHELSEYEVVMQNQGNLLCRDNVLFSTHAKCAEDEDYIGRTYFLHEADTAHLIFFSPNRLRVEAITPRTDLLIVNQNYSRYWHARVDGVRVPVLNTQGLLSIQFPAGKHTVDWQYIPTWIVIGAIFTVISYIYCGTYLWRLHKQ